jgi:hypothetical protein
LQAALSSAGYRKTDNDYNLLVTELWGALADSADKQFIAKCRQGKETLDWSAWVEGINDDFAMREEGSFGFVDFEVIMSKLSAFSEAQDRRARAISGAVEGRAQHRDWGAAADGGVNGAPGSGGKRGQGCTPEQRLAEAGGRCSWPRGRATGREWSASVHVGASRRRGPLLRGGRASAEFGSGEDSEVLGAPVGLPGATEVALGASEEHGSRIIHSSGAVHAAGGGDTSPAGAPLAAAASPHSQAVAANMQASAAAATSPSGIDLRACLSSLSAIPSSLSSPLTALAIISRSWTLLGMELAGQRACPQQGF